jgi:5-oxoprolinase (ATP-hydrolysing)
VVELELFTCRFLSLVEEMGVLLQRCAISVNVRERLDFSCALLDAGGELVANAPHIPVHLGALGMCVRAVRDSLILRPGDVVVTNHPAFGGSHLPDVTLIAPVHDGAGSLIGYVANRAHHAELGGLRPGSMPPGARCLAEEGVVIEPRHLVQEGVVHWEALKAVLTGGPYPSRAVEENIADLHAQLASVRRGADSLVALCSQVGLSTVHHFMRRLKARSAEALREALIVRAPDRCQAGDSMDDGTPILVRCEATGNGLRVDFSGSAGVHPGNLNATPAIVHSAVIYVLRLLAGKELPLNEGLLRDVQIIIPKGILSPEFPGDAARCPAVVGGNVETSQRMVDLLLQALGLSACSQGTMNNITFGNEHFSCYETVGGGAGALPDADGCSAVHVHMTNTAITDPEVMEVRMPVRLERFAIRSGSGGRGVYRGGDGIQRHIRFLEPAELSLLTQRRIKGPPGMAGGHEGVAGRQWIERTEGGVEPLAFSTATTVQRGDLLVIETPGGGGWGSPEA